MPTLSRETLDLLYDRYNRPELISPDPLQFHGADENAEDQEIAGLIAALLAYGRVTQILASIEKILTPLGPHPSVFIDNTNEKNIHRLYTGFKHRFTTGEEISRLLAGVAAIRRDYGSLERLFHAGSRGSDPLQAFTDELRSRAHLGATHLLPDPSKGSACKRLHLYLRWMVRHDTVDPGCWKSLSPSLLTIPLDTHMHRFALCYGFTERKQADLKTAREITDAFREINPGDPVKYDFALTRFGIRHDLCQNDLDELLRE